MAVGNKAESLEKNNESPYLFTYKVRAIPANLTSSAVGNNPQNWQQGQPFDFYNILTFY